MGNRRQFLSELGLVSAGMILGLTACKEKFKPALVGANDKINVALVGCSGRGIHQIWRGMKHLHEFRMVALCDVIQDRMDSAATIMPPDIIKYLDYRELVLNPDIDLVIVATPLKWHFEISKASILAGKHVVCEKSMTQTIEQAVELEQLAFNHDKAFKVSYEVHNNPAYQSAKKLVQNGVLGDIIHVDCTWNRRSSWRKEIKNGDQVIHFPTGEVSTRERMLNWRMSMEYGGGLMGELICHPLEAAEWILEPGPIQIATGLGNIGYWKDGRSSFDNIHANLEYNNNLIISCNSILSNALEDYTLSIYGRNATIKLGLSTGKLIPEAVRDESLTAEVDAITGASYHLIKRSENRNLRLSSDDKVRNYYKQFVDGYWLDTLMGYVNLAADIKAGKRVNTATTGKYNSIACIMANKAMHENEIQYWKPEYGS